MSSDNRIEAGVLVNLALAAQRQARIETNAAWVERLEEAARLYLDRAERAAKKEREGKPLKGV